MPLNIVNYKTHLRFVSLRLWALDTTKKILQNANFSRLQLTLGCSAGIGSQQWGRKRTAADAAAAAAEASPDALAPHAAALASALQVRSPTMLRRVGTPSPSNSLIQVSPASVLVRGPKGGRLQASQTFMGQKFTL